MHVDPKLKPSHHRSTAVPQPLHNRFTTVPQPFHTSRFALKASLVPDLKLKYGAPISNFAFKFNSRRYIKAYDFFGNLASAESSGTFILEITINGRGFALVHLSSAHINLSRSCR